MENLPIRCKLILLYWSNSQDDEVLKLHNLNQGSQQFPRSIFPDFWLKIYPFSLTKVLKKGSFSLSQIKWTFFPSPNSAIFKKKYWNFSKNPPSVLNRSGVLIFGGFHYYLEDPPWLGRTKKFWKIGIPRLAKNHQFQGILERNSLTFPWLLDYFTKIPWLFQVFPDFF